MPAVADDMAELTMVRAGALQGVVGMADRVTMSSAVEVTFGHELQTTVVLTLELATAREAITTDVRQSLDLWFASNENRTLTAHGSQEKGSLHDVGGGLTIMIIIMIIGIK